jgi:tetraacyldisaccharide-1-P 4'-kinase
VDVLDQVFPLGTMRESESTLARADLVVRKRLRAAGWVPPLPEGAAVGAFCGLGNPESFRRMLEGAGVRPVRWWRYPDHYVYSQGDLDRMLAEVGVLVTTEKDAVKVPAGAPVHWLAVEFDPEEGESLAEEARKVSYTNRRTRTSR